MTLFDTIFSFWLNWLYLGELNSDIYFTFNGELLNFEITQYTILYLLTLITVGFMIWLAFRLVQWLVNFVFSLFGGVK